jgi:hypothetical protein
MSYVPQRGLGPTAGPGLTGSSATRATPRPPTAACWLAVTVPGMHYPRRESLTCTYAPKAYVQVCWRCLCVVLVGDSIDRGTVVGRPGMALVEMSVVEQRYRAGTRYAGLWCSMVRLVVRQHAELGG